MKTELLGQEKNIVKVKVEFEAEEFTESLGKAVRELSDKAKIPGFRKGHISRKILEMRIGKRDLYAEALEKMLPKTIEQVVGDYDLETIDAPSLDLNIDNIQEGQPFTCELTFEVTPEVTLPEFEDIEVERLRCPEVTGEMSDTMVAEFRSSHATLNIVDRAAGEGDVVVITSLTNILDSDGETPIAQEPEISEVELTETLRSEIRDALLGKKANEQGTAEFVVDSGHTDKQLAGKKVRIEFTIEKVQEKILPEVGPEFYKEVTGSEFETEDAFREYLKERLIKHWENDIQTRIADTALVRLVEKSEMDVPDTLLNRQIDYLRERDTNEAKRRFDISLEDFLRLSSITPANYEQQLREEAVKAVRNTLVLDEVGEKFDIAVSKEEVAAEITRLSALYRFSPAQLKATFFKDKNRMAGMVSELRYNKIAQFIAGKVKVKDVDESILSEAEMMETALAEEGAE
jgi:trigger factor